VDEREIEEILQSIPPDEPRSRLEPYRELILRWRRQGRTYRRIRELLVEKFSINVTTPTLFRFVKRRARPRAEEPAAPEIQEPVSQVLTSPQPATPGKRLTPEERAAQVEYIRSLNQPTLQEKPEKPRWNFDVDKPRTLQKP
jgi:hypothetical protein